MPPAGASRRKEQRDHRKCGGHHKHSWRGPRPTPKKQADPLLLPALAGAGPDYSFLLPRNALRTTLTSRMVLPSTESMSMQSLYRLCQFKMNRISHAAGGSVGAVAPHGRDTNKRISRLVSLCFTVLKYATSLGALCIQSASLQTP